MREIQYCDISNKKTAYQIVGKGKVEVVVELGLLCCMAEWHDIAEQIAKTHTVLLYERAGVYHSEASEKERTPENIAKELYELLKHIPHEDGLILIGHSQGGLYVGQFARLYPDMVKGVILLDPLSAGDNLFAERLTKKEYHAGGIDKFNNLDWCMRLLKLHMGGIIKKVMKNAPPLYYYDFQKEDRDEILDSLVCLSSYATAKEEYKLSHQEKYICKLKEKNGFPDIPLILITHSSQFMIKETMEFGRTTYEIAEKVETLWQQIMKQYLEFTAKSEFIQAKKSGHYIHLTESELILDGLGRIMLY